MEQNKKNINNSSSDDIEFLDTENYGGFDKQVFSHQALVMRALGNILSCLNHELRAGWFNEKQDKEGNIIKTYVEDTRKKFIESVDGALIVMSRDLTPERNQSIVNLFSAREEIYKKLTNEQWDWFCNLSPREKSFWIGRIGKDFLNKGTSHYEEFMNEEIKIYKEIATELNNSTKDNDDYREEIYEA